MSRNRRCWDAHRDASRGLPSASRKWGLCRLAGWRLSLAALMWMSRPAAAWAGMPSFTLSDTASLRLEVISFFGIAFLACSAVVRWLWNSLRRDFPRLPVLSFPRAVGLTLVWGMLFLLVLTMISGARELLTPGAWRKEGLTYQLANPPTEPAAAAQESRAVSEPERLRQQRQESLRTLFAELSRRGSEPGTGYPSAAEFDSDWSSRFPLPERPGDRYVYAPPQALFDPQHVLVREPSVYDDVRLTLFLSGHIIEDIPLPNTDPAKPNTKDDQLPNPGAP